MMQMMAGSNDEFAGLTPGFIKPASVAWFASHHHDAAGVNKPYEYSYLFAYPVALPTGATTLTLPDNDKIRVLAVSVTGEFLPPAPPAKAARHAKPAHRRRR
jgi:alpha-mannosidase